MVVSEMRMPTCRMLRGRGEILSSVSVERAGYRLARKYFAGMEVFRRIPLLSNENRHPREAEEGCLNRISFEAHTR